MAIAFCGLDIGTFIRQKQPLRSLALRAVVYWSLYAAASVLGLVASRRLVRGTLTQANLPYVLWTAGFNSLFLCCFAAQHQLWRRWDARAACAPHLFQAINRHSLAIFLLVGRDLTQANLATGAVNLSIQTIHCTTLVAGVVLGAYLALVLGVLPRVLDAGAIRL